MYSHGFGTLFLAEAYGMTRRPEIREKLEKAVRLIIDTQNSEGGWRYQPVRRDADLSVTICQINALRAARNAGHLRAQGDGRRLHPVRQAVAEPRRRLPLHAPGRRQRLPAVGGRGRGPLQRGGLRRQGDRRRASPTSSSTCPRSSSASATATTSTATTTRPRRCGSAAATTGTPGIPAIRDELVRRQIAARATGSDSICHEYGTAMALIILQMPNNYLPIFQR